MTVFSEIVSRYGDEAILHMTTGTAAFRAFIQPVMAGHNSFRYKMTNLGEENTGRYLLFGPAGMDIPDDGTAWITCLGKTYDILKAEPFRVQGRKSHWEAVLKIREEEFDG